MKSRRSGKQGFTPGKPEGTTKPVRGRRPVYLKRETNSDTAKHPRGLAFAATLTDFGFDPWTLASSVLGFNLGIEAFQLLVILAAMSWLVLLARSHVYGPLRIAGEALTGTAAAAWFAERALGCALPCGEDSQSV